jgi:hypothetical protein
MTIKWFQPKESALTQNWTHNYTTALKFLAGKHKDSPEAKTQIKWLKQLSHDLYVAGRGEPFIPTPDEDGVYPVVEPNYTSVQSAIRQNTAPATRAKVWQTVADTVTPYEPPVQSNRSTGLGRFHSTKLTGRQHDKLVENLVISTPHEKGAEPEWLGKRVPGQTRSRASLVRWDEIDPDEVKIGDGFTPMKFAQQENWFTRKRKEIKRNNQKLLREHEKTLFKDGKRASKPQILKLLKQHAAPGTKFIVRENTQSQFNPDKRLIRTGTYPGIAVHEATHSQQALKHPLLMKAAVHGPAASGLIGYLGGMGSGLIPNKKWRRMALGASLAGANLAYLPRQVIERGANKVAKRYDPVITKKSNNSYLREQLILGTALPLVSHGGGKVMRHVIKKFAHNQCPITKLYTVAKLKPPVGKGEHKQAFHKLAIKLMNNGMERNRAYATAMKILGRNQAVHKSHWSKNYSAITLRQARRIPGTNIPTAFPPLTYPESVTASLDALKRSGRLYPLSLAGPGLAFVGTSFLGDRLAKKRVHAVAAKHHIKLKMGGSSADLTRELIGRMQGKTDKELTLQRVKHQMKQLTEPEQLIDAGAKLGVLGSTLLGTGHHTDEVINRQRIAQDVLEFPSKRRAYLDFPLKQVRAKERMQTLVAAATKGRKWSRALLPLNLAAGVASGILHSTLVRREREQLEAKNKYAYNFDDVLRGLREFEEDGAIAGMRKAGKVYLGLGAGIAGTGLALRLWKNRHRKRKNSKEKVKQMALKNYAFEDAKIGQVNRVAPLRVPIPSISEEDLKRHVRNLESGFAPRFKDIADKHARRVLRTKREQLRSQLLNKRSNRRMLVGSLIGGGIAGAAALGAQAWRKHKRAQARAARTMQPQKYNLSAVLGLLTLQTLRQKVAESEMEDNHRPIFVYLPSAGGYPQQMNSVDDEIQANSLYQYGLQEGWRNVKWHAKQVIDAIVPEDFKSTFWNAAYLGGMKQLHQDLPLPNMEINSTSLGHKGVLPEFQDVAGMSLTQMQQALQQARDRTSDIYQRKAIEQRLVRVVEEQLARALQRQGRVV